MTRTLKLISAIALAAGSTVPAFAGDVQISLGGVIAAKGDLYIALQKKDEFLQPRGSHGEIVKLPNTGDQKLVFRNVTPGDYSVSVWHDNDGDGTFSMDAKGMPADGWTMHNAQQLRAAPQWDAVKFTVPARGTTLSLAMIYPTAK
jgi:uncharacterized protein (DUF2141 family)